MAYKFKSNQFVKYMYIGKYSDCIGRIVGYDPLFAAYLIDIFFNGKIIRTHVCTKHLIAINGYSQDEMKGKIQ